MSATTISLISRETREDVFGIKDLSVQNYRILWHWIVSGGNQRYITEDFYRIAINAVNKRIFKLDTIDDFLDQTSIVQETVIHLSNVYTALYVLSHFPNAMTNKSDKDKFEAFLHVTAFNRVTRLVNEKLKDLKTIEIEEEKVKQFRWGCDWERWNAFDEYYHISTLIDEGMELKKVKAKIAKQANENKNKNKTILSLHDEVMRRRKELYKPSVFIRSNFNTFGTLTLSRVDDISAMDYLFSFMFEKIINNTRYIYFTRHDYHIVNCASVDDNVRFSIALNGKDYWGEIPKE